MTDASALDADIRWDNLKKENSMDLSYATQFSVDYYTGGYKLISVSDIAGLPACAGWEECTGGTSFGYYSD